MEDILEYIERYKYGIIGTTVIHIAAFFYFNFKTIEQPFHMPEPQVEMMIPLDDIDFDPEIMEQLKQTKDNQVVEEVYNVSADQNDSRDKSYENFSTQELDEQVESEARMLEQQYFEEWAATHDNGSGDGNDAGADLQIDKNNNDKRNQNNIDKNNIQIGGSNAFAGEVMVSFNLPNRKAHSLPRPGYTCNSSGTVVIDVKVDKSGSVKSATYNSSLSRSASECMIEKAMRYAKKSRFNFSGSATGTQEGTITYKFVSK